jgi:hypothetical protein
VKPKLNYFFPSRADSGCNSGEFSLYDHVLDHSAAFNAIPNRYVGLGLSPLDVYFAMGRGRQADGVDVPACEMKKWSIPDVLPLEVSALNSLR